MAQAYRFLAQSSMGPTPALAQQVQTQGLSGWVDAQLAMAPSTPTHLAQAELSTIALAQPRPRGQDVVFAWWTHTLQQPDQLRQRVAYALSQIFVVSISNSTLGDNARMVASYADMLSERSTGTFRELLEGVALHPAMGTYLSHLQNRKEDTFNGRVPDENFAREVMQLFSIGLYELNDDGSLKLRDGQPIETYNADDVKGLAKVFTGLGWHRLPNQSGPWWECFYATGPCYDPVAQQSQLMSTYAQEHSTSIKRFLGVSIPAQNPANPNTSIRIALDRLANHPNTAPFISQRLIQHLVTSNPSPGYVQRISQVFRSSGGQLKSVVKAILLDPEARSLPTGASLAGYGKLREPVLRFAHLLRALPTRSTNWALAQAGQSSAAFYLASDTSNVANGLGQTPMASPSVFNFYRPGYQPPQTQLAGNKLLAPEMQLSNETSVVGYANFVAQSLAVGWGLTHPSTQLADIQFDLSSFMALDDAAHAQRPQALVDAVALALLGSALPEAISERVLAAVGRMPQGNALNKRRRAAMAILMIAVSPAFIVQQ